MLLLQAVLGGGSKVLGVRVVDRSSTGSCVGNEIFNYYISMNINKSFPTIIQLKTFNYQKIIQYNYY